jgi:Ca2+-binding EF-hand superfamily protein
VSRPAQYEEFVEGLARGATGDTSAIPKPKARRVTDPLADPRSYLKPGVTPEDLVAAHTSVRDKLLSKHGTIHKAFKFMDKDGSGFINRAEFEGALRQLNLNLPKAVLDSLMDIIDVEDDDDGDEDHDIAFREFARVMQAADVFKMGVLEPRPDQSKRDLARQTARQEALEHLRPGVTCDELRKYQELVKSKIQAKHKTSAFTSAFKWIDADRTGSITREEFKEALASLNLNMVRPAVLETLCDFIDSDGSGSFGYAEFSRVLAADDVMQMAPGKLKKAGLI